MIDKREDSSLEAQAPAGSGSNASPGIVAIFFLLLFALWLVLSGYFTNPLLLFFGVASSAFTIYLALRMRVLDREGFPVQFTLGLVRYWPWLWVQIVKSNIDVMRRVLSPSLPISPMVARVPSTQKTAAGQVIYANSITLTPGTVSIRVEDGQILVHSLTQENVADLEAGDMDRRVTQMEGGR